MKEYKDSPALDAGLLAAAQAVEHYEIARYGTLKAWARELKLNDVVRLLDMTLDEEVKTDEALSELAEGVINQEAAAAYPLVETVCAGPSTLSCKEASR
jgi:ferritin-like metal-binding protein YciE